MKTAIELFVIGVLFSFGPCGFLCEPVILPYLAAARTSWQGGLRAVLAFSAARLAAICVLGAAAGMAGRTATELLRRHGNVLFYGSGALACLLGILIAMGRQPRWAPCAALQRFCAKNTLKGAALLGAAIGSLPCFLFLGILALIAAHAGGLLSGMALGLAFGLGKTLSPVVALGVVAGALPERIIKSESGRVLFQRLAGAVLLLMGINVIAAQAFPA
jgi:sulfite exporter TauE/SafE